MGRYKSAIPDRWIDYKALGKRIPETRFICCKCPLKEELCRKLPSKSKWFTPECLFRILAEENFSLGLVIDLTNTDRYYNPNAFTYTGVEYAKIFTPGHDVPGEDAIKMFRDIILTYEKNNDNKDKLIAVHCTHGVNRTGYQICHYLIETCGWSFEKAVQAFNLARGHQIERQNYLDALHALDNKVNNKPHIFLHEDADSSDDDDDDSSVKRKRIRRQHSDSSSSTSSADSLFKPEPKAAAAPEPFIPPVAQVANVSAVPFVSPFAPPATVAAAAAAPMFNPAVMQHMLMNVQAQMQQAMMNSNRFMPPPLQLPPANLMQPGGGLVFRPPGYTAPVQTMANASQSKDTSSSSSSSDNSTTSSGTTSESSSESEAEEEEQEESSSSSTEKEDAKKESEDEQSVLPSGSIETEPGQPTADWELGGKVDVKKKTAAQKRRERQKRVAEMHKTLQSGKFWKIREMQKEKYGF